MGKPISERTTGTFFPGAFNNQLELFFEG